MQRLEVSGAVRPIYGSLGVKRLSVTLTLRIPKYRRKGNIKINLKVIDWDSVEWTYLAQDRDKLWAVLSRVINTVMGCTMILLKQQPLCEARL